jgi:N-acetylglutamate synthase-like GNAT family acetyltransferase
MIKIRTANLEDKDKIVELINSMEQNSYIVRFIDEWLKSINEKVFVAEDDGKIVGIAHFFIQNENVAWFEAARIHKEYRNKGIGTMLANVMLDFVKNLGIKKARLVTGGTNIPAQKHLAKTKFKLYSKWVAWKIDFQKINIEDLAFKEANFEEIWNYLNNSKCFVDSGKLYFDSWIFYDFTKDWLKNKINENKVFFDGNGIVIFDEMSRFKGSFQTSYFEAKNLNVMKLLSYIIKQAKKINVSYDKIFIVTPANEELINVLKNVGELRSELLIYEAKID